MLKWILGKLKEWLGITTLEMQFAIINKESKFLAVDYGIKDFSAICFMRKGAFGAHQDYVEVVTIHPNIPLSEVRKEAERMAREWGIPRERILRDGFGYTGVKMDSRDL